MLNKFLHKIIRKKKETIENMVCSFVVVVLLWKEDVAVVEGVFGLNM